MTVFTPVPKTPLNWNASEGRDSRYLLISDNVFLNIGSGFRLLIGRREAQVWSKPSKTQLSYPSTVNTSTPTPVSWSNVSKS